MACFQDEIPSLRRYRGLVTAGVCVALFAIGLPMCMEVSEHSVEHYIVCKVYRGRVANVRWYICFIFSQKLRASLVS